MEYFYKDNGDLYVWGNNTLGELGFGHRETIPHPTFLLNNKNIKFIYRKNEQNLIHSSYSSIYMYTEDEFNNGCVYVWGKNSYGVLGLGHSDDVLIPTILFNNIKIKQLICDFSIYLYTDKGDLYVWGYNSNGALGLGHKRHMFKPVLLLNDPKIKEIVYSKGSVFMYKENGDLYVWGNNGCGQLGLGHCKNMTTPTYLLNDSTIKFLKCGYDFVLIYKDNGDLYGMGDNSRGQLGIPHTANEEINNDQEFIEKIEIEINNDQEFMEEEVEIEINNDREYDENDDYEREDEEGESEGEDENDDDDDDDNDNDDDDGDRMFTISKPTLLINDKNISNIFCSLNSVYIQKNNGDIMVQGDNIYGELGLGHRDIVTSPTLLLNAPTVEYFIFDDHCAYMYMKNGDLFGWGENSTGQLGYCNNCAILTPTLLLNANYIRTIFFSQSHQIFNIYSDTDNVYGCGNYMHNNYYDCQLVMSEINEYFACHRDIRIINGVHIPRWSVSNHKSMSISVREKIFISLLCFKRNIHKYVIPRFVKYIIFGFI
jgi:alpha-tubulin suppressor-like RCC1 family protein